MCFRASYSLCLKLQTSWRSRDCQTFVSVNPLNLQIKKIQQGSPSVHRQKITHLTTVEMVKEGELCPFLWMESIGQWVL